MIKGFLKKIVLDSENDADNENELTAPDVFATGTDLGTIVVDILASLWYVLLYIHLIYL